MIVKSVIKAFEKDTNEFIDQYEYDRPLDQFGKDCLELWTNFTELYHPGCTFETLNLHDAERTGETFSLPKEINERSLF